MDEDVAFGVELRGLLAALEVEDFREDLGHEAGIDKEVEAGLAVGGKPDAVEFVADAFGADFGNQGGGFLEGGPGGGFDGEAEGGGEANGAEESEVVFLEAGGGFADSANELGIQVGLAIDVVDERAGFGIVEEAIDGEVPALGILFGGGERDGLRAAAIAVRAVGAEGGDFDPAFAGGWYDDDSEVGTDELAAREEFGDLSGVCGSGDVVVFGITIEEEVTDGATGQVG